MLFQTKSDKERKIKCCDTLNVIESSTAEPIGSSVTERF